ncbi:MAG TPA: polyprenyl synthetase family protein [Verrucomicrobiae bacterium]|nr:polyprenyl synthetase family protein [Verrucomicrobiae bacterium]
MENILSYQKTLAADLAQYFSDRADMKNTNPWHVDITAQLEQYLTGGKLLRGSLVCFAHEAFGGELLQAARRTAMALELTHSALLIHDDVIDRDALRRGRAAMHLRYQALATTADAAHFGESMAICVADAAIFLAFERLASVDIPAVPRQRLITFFTKALVTVCAGQMLDIELGYMRGGVKKRDILMVMEQKTAAYSITLPLVAGAILADQPDTVIRALSDLGRLVGIIFQIRDDELGVFGDPEKTGKPAGSDIKEGKKTLLYYYLMQRCSGSEKRRLLSIFGNQQVSSDNIDYVRQVMIRAQVPSTVNREVKALSRQAAKLIADLPLTPSGQADLLGFLSFCAKRDV